MLILLPEIPLVLSSPPSGLCPNGTFSMRSALGTSSNIATHTRTCTLTHPISLSCFIFLLRTYHYLTNKYFTYVLLSISHTRI